MRTIPVFLLTILLLWGCKPASPTKPGSTSSIVTKISIEAPAEGEEPYRLYTSDDKIRATLDFLRGLDRETTDVAEAPEPKDGIWRINCQYADGRVRRYDLYEGLYLREDTGDWITLSENVQGSFATLLRQYSSDAMPDETETSGDAAQEQYKIPVP